MCQKERLVELLISNELRDTPEEAASELQERADYFKSRAEKCADYLLANGVIALPFKVGDTVWYIFGFISATKEPAHVGRGTVTEVSFTHVFGDYIQVRNFDNNEFLNIAFRDIPKYIFATREQAEKALRERES